MTHAHSNPDRIKLRYIAAPIAAAGLGILVGVVIPGGGSSATTHHAAAAAPAVAATPLATPPVAPPSGLPAYTNTTLTPTPGIVALAPSTPAITTPVAAAITPTTSTTPTTVASTTSTTPVSTTSTSTKTTPPSTTTTTTVPPNPVTLVWAGGWVHGGQGQTLATWINAPLSPLVMASTATLRLSAYAAGTVAGDSYPLGHLSVAVQGNGWTAVNAGASGSADCSNLYNFSNQAVGTCQFTLAGPGTYGITFTYNTTDPNYAVGGETLTLVVFGQ